MSERPVIVLSGGFDPIHVGHLRMIQDAARFGDVTILLNSDAWLTRKKGKPFMEWGDRHEILKGLSDVRKVFSVNDDDGTVVDGLGRVRPDIFGNGGDRTFDNTPEQKFCEQERIHLLWGLGGQKVRSSSELVKNAKNDVE